jgi:hypothetical protein
LYEMHSPNASCTSPGKTAPRYALLLRLVRNRTLCPRAKRAAPTLWARVAWPYPSPLTA